MRAAVAAPGRDLHQSKPGSHRKNQIAVS